MSWPIFHDLTLSVHLNSPINIRVSVVWRRNRFPKKEPRYSTAESFSMATSCASSAGSGRSHVGTLVDFRCLSFCLLPLSESLCLPLRILIDLHYHVTWIPNLHTVVANQQFLKDLKNMKEYIRSTMHSLLAIQTCFRKVSPPWCK